jgi:hypothetical protein
LYVSSLYRTGMNVITVTVKGRKERTEKENCLQETNRSVPIPHMDVW